MPVSRTSLLGLAGLCLWLMLYTVGWPGMLGSGEWPIPIFGLGRPLPASLAGLPLVPLALLRVAGAALAEGRSKRWVSAGMLGLWLLFCTAFGAWLALQVLASDPLGETLYVPAVVALVAYPLLQAGAGAVAWWVADRLDAMELDGGFVLLVPPAVMAFATWAAMGLNRFFAGLMEPLHALGSPLLPLIATTLLVILRPPSAERGVLGDWTPRTALPVLLMPFVAHACLAPLLPEAALAAASWLGVGVAGLILLRCAPGPRRPWWPLFFAGLVPVQVLIIAGTLWGSGVLERRYAGDIDGTWAITFAEPISPTDVQRVRARVERAELTGEVHADGSVLRVSLRGVEPGGAEWWLRRVGTRPGVVGLHRAHHGPDAEAEIQRLTGGSDRPSTWAPAPPGKLLGHRRCPGRHCIIILLSDSVIGPDEISDVRTGFEPLDWRGWLEIVPTADALARLRAAPASEQGFMLTLDGRVYGMARLRGDHLVLPSRPSWLRRLPERFEGGALDADWPSSITLESTRPRASPWRRDGPAPGPG